MPMTRTIIASDALSAVERWAGDDYWCERETGIVLDHGRLDALLVPLTWKASRGARGGKYGQFGLYGVEVKVSRSDFMAGLRSGQFERYRDAEALAGVYVATPKGLAKTKELPEGVGHLVINTETHWSRNEWVAVCRRKPAHSGRQAPASALWRVIERMAYRNRMAVYEEAERRKEEDRRIGEGFGAAIGGTIARYRKQIRKQQETPSDG